MKLFHISDLHLGKRVNEYSMLPEQDFILRQMLDRMDEEKPDGVLIAGDVYDKSVPPAEAVQLFDRFLVRLAEREIPVFVISGNHDSPERIAFGAQLMDARGVYLSPVYGGETKPITLTDEYGAVDVYLLPFLKSAHVRRYAEEEIASCTDAVRWAVSRMELNPAHRSVLVAHQFVTGSTRSDSEEVSVGGADNVDAEVFAPFDYVALGHLHTAQRCGSERVRYCGTPLKYSFSEARDQKSITVAELREKGSLTVRTIPLTPEHDLVELRGAYAEVTQRSFYENTTWQEDYTHITLTDEQDIPDAVGKLRAIYHRLMKLDYDNCRTRSGAVITGAQQVETKSPLELFSDFYALQNGQPMSAEQTAFMRDLIEQTWEGAQ